MVRRGGMRRWVRWGGLALTVALPLVWGASMLRHLTYVCSTDGLYFNVGLGTFSVVSNQLFKNWSGPTWFVREYHPSLPARPIWLPDLQPSGTGWLIDIPLWIPWALAAGFTAWRFRADRVMLSDACPECGYDKRGLDAAAPCPECGAGAGTVVVPGG